MRDLQREFFFLRMSFRLRYGWNVCLIILTFSMVGVEWDWMEDDMITLAILSFCIFSVVGYHDLLVSNSGQNEYNIGVILAVIIFYCVSYFIP